MVADIVSAEAATALVVAEAIVLAAVGIALGEAAVIASAEAATASGVEGTPVAVIRAAAILVGTTRTDSNIQVYQVPTQL
jgi:hypothetical protein